MSDKDFIDKLNDKMINYGYIIIDIENYVYYFDRYNIKNYYENYYEKEYSKGVYFYRFLLLNVKENMIEFGFKSVNMIINDYLSIFELVKQDTYRTDKFFPVDFANFIITIEGNSKEEILLKLQMMGY